MLDLTWPIFGKLKRFAFLAAICWPIICHSSPATIEIADREDSAAWVESKFEFSTGRSVPNTGWPTRSKFWLKDGALHALVQADDAQPDLIVSSEGPHDSVQTGDSVMFVVDALGNGRRSFRFEVGASGSTSDRISSSYGESAPYWTGIWKSEAKRTEAGYQVRFAIPLRTIGLPDRADQSMQIGLDVRRYIGRGKGDSVSIAELDQSDACGDCKMPRAQLPAYVNAQPHAATYVWSVSPYVAAVREASSGQKSASSAYAGVDASLQTDSGAKWRATIRPDYLQLDIDQPVVRVNRRFAFFLRENRPFFTQESDFLQFPTNLINTRSMTDIEAAGSYSHQNKSTSFAILAARDNQTNFIIPGIFGSTLKQFDQPSDNVIARLTSGRDGDLRVGGLLAARSAESLRYAGAGADILWTINKSHQVTAAIVASRANEVGAASSGTHAYVRNFISTEGWLHDTIFQQIGNGYRAPFGQLDQSSLRSLSHSTYADTVLGKDRSIQAIYGGCSIQVDQTLANLRLKQYGICSASLTWSAGHSASVYADQGKNLHQDAQLSSRSISLNALYKFNDRLTGQAIVSAGRNADIIALQSSRYRSATAIVNANAGGIFTAGLTLQRDELGASDGAGYVADIGSLTVAVTLANRHQFNAAYAMARSVTRYGQALDTALSQNDANWQVSYIYRPTKHDSVVFGLRESCFTTGDGSRGVADRSAYIKLVHTFTNQ